MIAVEQPQKAEKLHSKLPYCIHTLLMKGNI